MPEITIPSLTRTHSGKLLALFSIVLIASADGPAQWRHPYTFGAPRGIHPPRLLNRELARVAMGNPENPYGLLHPVAAATDSRGRVWITDSGTGSVHIFDTDGGGYQELRSAGNVRFQRPAGIVTDRQGCTYLGDMGTGA